ncbi:hypothetical protein EJ08DRAFT_34943 [Tothia fuscella]|uniref:Uncharacterized protein n=1 Tax=Tothia fuscella TaxID=1048955 RepID=A0A9P4NG97_9PEZI|nr:hypothetical protein EJ08DRAFT_34943 [Tothia fuscella]
MILVGVTTFARMVHVLIGYISSAAAPRRRPTGQRICRLHFVSTYHSESHSYCSPLTAEKTLGRTEMRILISPYHLRYAPNPGLRDTERRIRGRKMRRMRHTTRAWILWHSDGPYGSAPKDGTMRCLLSKCRLNSARVLFSIPSFSQIVGVFLGLPAMGERSISLSCHLEAAPESVHVEKTQSILIVRLETHIFCV